MDKKNFKVELEKADATDIIAIFLLAVLKFFEKHPDLFDEFRDKFREEMKKNGIEFVLGRMKK